MSESQKGKILIIAVHSNSQLGIEYNDVATVWLISHLSKKHYILEDWNVVRAGACKTGYRLKLSKIHTYHRSITHKPFSKLHDFPKIKLAAQTPPTPAVHMRVTATYPTFSLLYTYFRTCAH